MEDLEIINLWKSYDKKLEDNLRLNRKNADDITKIKVKSFLSAMKPLKIFAILAGILWVVFLDVLILNLINIVNPFFLVSAIIQVLLTKVAIVIYLYQLVLIHQVDISKPIIETQETLARLKSSTIWIARFLFLQFPVWTTFYINKGMLENGNLFLFVLQGVITSAFTVLAIWLFLNIKYENKDKKWFKLIFSGNEWEPVLKSIEMLNQVEEYKIESELPQL